MLSSKAGNTRRPIRFVECAGADGARESPIIGAVAVKAHWPAHSVVAVQLLSLPCLELALWQQECPVLQQLIRADCWA
jgi:hypothetical protein